MKPSHYEALPGFWGTGRIRPFISREQESKTEGTMRTKAILGNREHRKDFDFGEQGKMAIFLGKHGTSPPPTATASSIPRGGGGGAVTGVIRVCEPVFQNLPHSYTWPSKKRTHSYT